ncbi:MAG: hypothetical protein H8E37_03585 [Planctomycetes bacterium]|nr:hypothetical protein [Planctomycetota bacterium]
MALYSNRQLRIVATICVASVFLIGSSLPAGADKGDEASKEKQALAESGPKVGATIHPFFVRAVTGPHRNRSVCYVCRYGSRPVVMVVMQKVDPKIGSLLTELDTVIDKNRVSGLRGFGVLVTDESSRAVPILQTMAFDEKIHMPLTAATTAIAGSGSHNLHPEAATTIILYRGQKAVESIPLKAGRINEKEVSRIRDRVTRFVRK